MEKNVAYFYGSKRKRVIRKEKTALVLWAS